VATNKDWYIMADASANAIAITLPDPASTGFSYEYTIKKRDGTANAVTITPAVGTIDGAANYVLNAINKGVTLVNHFGNYFIKCAI
jgi:hypothetical protein